VSERDFTSMQRKKVIYEEKSTETGEIKEWNNRKVKGRKTGK